MQLLERRLKFSPLFIYSTRNTIFADIPSPYIGYLFEGGGGGGGAGGRGERITMLETKRLLFTKVSTAFSVNFMQVTLLWLPI